MSTKFSGSVRIRGPQWAHLPLLTLGVLGLQIVWSVEMAYASAYLLSLGLSPAVMSLVFVAGPLSGFIVQPLIGSLADKSTSRWGRRRPYIVSGCLICVFGMLLLGFTRNAASIFTRTGSHANDVLTRLFATVAIFVIDFSINAVQAMDRALIVDTLPRDAQELANAWASRMIGIGHVLGFFIGNISLTSLPWLSVFGKTQLQIFSVLTAIILTLTHLITVFAVSERRLVRDVRAPNHGVVAATLDVWKGVLSLPVEIRHICIVQFFAWAYWFPILFFSSEYVAELYRLARSTFHLLDIDEDATIHGARAMFFNSLVALCTSIVAPWFVADPTRRSRWRVHVASIWAFSHFIVVFSMGLTLLPSSWQLATAMVTLTGFSFTVAEWAPFALIAKVLLQRGDHLHDHPQPVYSDEETIADEEGPMNHERHASNERETGQIEQGQGTASGHESLHGSTGMILGIHNVFVVLPQFVMTAVSSVVFALSGQRPHGDEFSEPSTRDPPTNRDGFVIIYRIAGCSGLVAWYLTWKLSKRLQRERIG